MKGRKPVIGASSEAAKALEERFAFQRGTISEIEKTKAMIAHPGWVQLTASHPSPQLPALENAKPPLLPPLEKRTANVGKIGFSLALPEMGERRKKPEEK